MTSSYTPPTLSSSGSPRSLPLWAALAVSASIHIGVLFWPAQAEIALSPQAGALEVSVPTGSSPAGAEASTAQQSHENDSPTPKNSSIEASNTTLLDQKLPAPVAKAPQAKPKKSTPSVQKTATVQSTTGQQRPAATSTAASSDAPATPSAKPTPYAAAWQTADGPRFLKHVAPEYPDRARRTGKEGRVVIEIQLDAEGTLLHAAVTQSAGSALDAAAMKSIARSTYVPAKRGNAGVACSVSVPIRFMLKENS